MSAPSLFFRNKPKKRIADSERAGAFIITNPDGSKDLLYEPQPKQRLYHASTVPNLIMEGRRGTGKSLCMRWDMHIRALTYPGYTYLMLRRTMPELRKSHLLFINQEMENFARIPGFERATYLKGVSEAHYGNGSIGLFGHCYDEQTETLTRRGFVRFAELTDDDELATLDPDTNVMTYERPSARQVFDFDGELVRVQSKKIDLAITPDHPMLCWSKYDTPMFERADSIETMLGREPHFRTTAIWKGRERPTKVLESGDGRFTVPAVSMDEWLTFLGWFLSEGSASEWATPAGRACSVDISQKKNAAAFDELVEMVQGWGFTVHVMERENGLRVMRVSQRQLFEQVRQLGQSHEKFVPRDVMGLSVRQLTRLLDTLFAGDGSHCARGYRTYTTTSPRLAADVQELLLKVGLVGTVCPRPAVEGRKPCWDVCVSHVRQEPGLVREHLSRERYTGKVYDVTMPMHSTLLVRRNGKVVWGHNCETDADVLKYLSAQFHAINFDEITTFDWDMITKISTSCRVETEPGLMSIVRGGTNPIGVSAEEVHRYFIAKDVTPEEDPEYVASDWGHIKLLREDNQYIDFDQYDKRFAGLPEAYRKGWLEGVWGIEGAYFNIQPQHLVQAMPHVSYQGRSMPAIDYPWIHIYRILDWGFHPDPAFCLWVAVLPNGREIPFHERFWFRTPAAQVAADLKQESDAMHIVATFADPTLWDGDKEMGHCLADEFETRGVPLVKAKNDRTAAGFAIQEHFHQILPDGLPKLQIYENGAYGAPMLVRSLRSMRVDKKRPGRLADHKHDHATICLGYFCMAGVGPTQMPTQSTIHKWMQPRTRRRILGSDGVRRSLR